MDLGFKVLTAKEASDLSMENLKEEDKLFVKSVAKEIEEAAKSGKFEVNVKGYDHKFKLCCLAFEGYNIRYCIDTITIKW